MYYITLLASSLVNPSDIDIVYPVELSMGEALIFIRRIWRLQELVDCYTIAEIRKGAVHKRWNMREFHSEYDN